MTELQQHVVEYPHVESFFQWSANVLSVESGISLQQVLAWCGASKDEANPKQYEQRQQWRNRAVGMFTIQRITHKRFIATPSFAQLPAKAKTVDGTRWRVEQYGNSLCTTEFVGGEAQILFVLKKTRDTSKMAHVFDQPKQPLCAAHDHPDKEEDAWDSNESTWLMSKYEMKCFAVTRGFNCPRKVTLKTLVEVHKLMAQVTRTPIDCPVPVKQELLPITNVTGFPMQEIRVVVQVHETALLKRLEELVQQCEMLQTNENQLHQDIVKLVDDLMLTMANASINARSQYR